MLVANPFSKKRPSLSRKKQRRDHAEDPNHNLDVETMRKLRMYQRRTYMNQEQSRRRSLQRHNKNHPTQGDEDVLPPSRPSSAPNTTANDYHGQQQQQQYGSEEYRQRSSSELQVPSPNRYFKSNTRWNVNSKEKVVDFTIRPRVYSEASRLKHILEYQEQTASMISNPASEGAANADSNENDATATQNSASLCQIIINCSPDIATRHAVENDEETNITNGEPNTKSPETHMKSDDTYIKFDGNEMKSSATQIKSGEIPMKSGATQIKSGKRFEKSDEYANCDCDSSPNKSDIKLLVNTNSETVSKPEETFTKALVDAIELSTKESVSNEKNVALTTTKTTKNKHRDISRQGSTKISKRSKYLLSCISSD